MPHPYAGRPCEESVLAGGTGSRLSPDHAGRSASSLLPVYDKPMIYYPLSTLMLAGIREILVITTPDDGGGFRPAARRRVAFGMRIELRRPAPPDGLAQAFVIGADFIGDESVALVLGDNIFYGVRPRARSCARRRRDGGRGLRLPRGRPVGVRRRRVRRRGPRAVHRGEAGQTPRATTPCRGSTSTTTTWWHRGECRPSAAASWRSRSVNEAYLRQGRLTVERAPSRHRVARHGHVRLARAGHRVRPGDRGAAGLQDRLPGGGRLAQRVDLRRGDGSALAQPLLKSGYGQYLLRSARATRRPGG